MRIALVYDLRDEYRALGYSEEEVAEFDSAARRFASAAGRRLPPGLPPASASISCSPSPRG
jgi:hypothetical protein